MATCVPNEVLAEGACFDCLDPWQLEVAKAVLLCRILQASDPMASCDINDLLSEGACFNCLAPAQMQVVQSQLLCNIEANGGGGGGGGQQVYVNSGDPNGVVTHNATTPAYCLDTLNNVAWWKTDGVASDTGWY